MFCLRLWGNRGCCFVFCTEQRGEMKRLGGKKSLRSNDRRATTTEMTNRTMPPSQTRICRFPRPHFVKTSALGSLVDLVRTLAHLEMEEQRLDGLKRGEFFFFFFFFFISVDRRSKEMITTKRTDPPSIPLIPRLRHIPTFAQLVAELHTKTRAHLEMKRKEQDWRLAS